LWEWRQTSEDVIEEPRLFELLVEFHCGGEPYGHPLAVGRDHIFGVREYPVEAATARDEVSRRWPVDDVQHVVAIPTREGVSGGFVEGTVEQVVVAVPARYVIGAGAAVY
jgi:hypothetical protein